ncbi:MAG: hypothetical protein JSS86_23380 [Cyanobacteria bacterium SZAS LIN-2]|nr:hypothetical protein [Cyanobacteria bacterium SZAS LIN-2]
MSRKVSQPHFTLLPTISLIAAIICLFPPVSAAATRTIVFPQKFSLGTLYRLQLERDNDLLLYSTMVKDRSGAFIAEAKGKVLLPTGKRTMIYLFPSYDLIDHPEALAAVDCSFINCISFAGVSAMVPVDTVLPALAHMTGLRRLEIEGAELTDEQTMPIKAVKSLQSLSLSSNLITGTFLQELPNFPRLEDLNLSFNALKPGSFKYVGQCKNLLWLDVSRAQVNDAALAELAHLQKLSFLGIKGAKITARGIREINKMRSLRHVDMTGSSATVRDLLLLKDSALTKIDFPRNNYSAAELAALQRALPRIYRPVTAPHVDEDIARDFSPLH